MDEEIAAVAKVAGAISAASGAGKKFMGLIQSVFGFMYEPHQSKEIVQEKVNEINQIGQAVRDNSDLDIRYEDGKVTVQNKPMPTLAERAQTKENFLRQRKQKNLEEILDKTYDILEGQPDKKTSAQDVPLDWMLDYSDRAEKVDDEDLQQAWAQLLAEKIIDPNRYNKKTMEVLQNLTSREARIFNNLCKYAVKVQGKLCVPNVDKMNNKYAIRYEDILEMDDYELINSMATTNCKFPVQKRDSIAIEYGRYILLVKAKQFKQREYLDFQCFPMTKAGSDIASLAEHETDLSFFLDFCKELNHSDNVVLEVHEVKKWEADAVHYDIENLLR